MRHSPPCTLTFSDESDVPAGAVSLNTTKDEGCVVPELIVVMVNQLYMGS